MAAARGARIPGLLLGDHPPSSAVALLLLAAALALITQLVLLLLTPLDDAADAACPPLLLPGLPALLARTMRVLGLCMPLMLPLGV